MDCDILINHLALLEISLQSTREESSHVYARTPWMKSYITTKTTSSCDKLYTNSVISIWIKLMDNVCVECVPPLPIGRS